MPKSDGFFSISPPSMPCAFIKNPAAESLAMAVDRRRAATAQRRTQLRSNDVAQGNGNPFKVHCLKDTNFGSGMAVEWKVVRICHAYWRGNEVATFLGPLLH